MRNESLPEQPSIVSAEKWDAAMRGILAKEKDLTRRSDELAAMRRRLPMVEVEKDYQFDGENNTPRLLDLFEGRRQLLVYHFMFGPEDAAGCSGCSWVVDSMGHVAHINARDTSRVLVSRAPISTLSAFKARMGWSVPWYSSSNNSFNQDFGVSTDSGERFGLSVFLRDGKRIYRTYFTTGRGLESLGSHWSYLDRTPLGRQEQWEDSPAGWPQSEPYSWWRRHDEYA